MSEKCCVCHPEPPKAKSKRMKVCDGSWVSWTPRWEPVGCDECGRVNGFEDAAEPEFHLGKVERREDDGRYYTCCGEKLAGLAELNQLTLERMAPAIIEQFERSSPLLALLKRNRA